MKDFIKDYGIKNTITAISIEDYLKVFKNNAIEMGYELPNKDNCKPFKFEEPINYNDNLEIYLSMFNNLNDTCIWSFSLNDILNKAVEVSNFVYVYDEFENIRAFEYLG